MSDLEFRSTSARLSVEPCGSRPRYMRYGRRRPIGKHFPKKIHCVREAFPPMKPFESTRGQVRIGFSWKVSLLSVSRLTVKETKACLEKFKVVPFDFALVWRREFFPNFLHETKYPFIPPHCSQNRNGFRSRIVRLSSNDVVVLHKDRMWLRLPIETVTF